MFKKALLITLIALQGCSVYMAADGKPDPHISHFHTEMSRFQIESVLGSPVSLTKTENNNKLAIYEFEIGNEPDSNRAIAWLIADIFLLFIPEFVGTPYELSRGEEKRIRVTYDPNDVVIKLEI